MRRNCTFRWYSSNKNGALHLAVVSRGWKSNMKHVCRSKQSRVYADLCKVPPWAAISDTRHVAFMPSKRFYGVLKCACIKISHLTPIYLSSDLSKTRGEQVTGRPRSQSCSMISFIGILLVPTGWIIQTLGWYHMAVIPFLLFCGSHEFVSEYHKAV
jgi:hypothetical protein